MHSTLLSTTLLIGAVLAQNSYEVPEGPLLPVSFGSVQITPGQQIGIDVPASQPTIGLPEGASETGTYLLVIVDPDAPTPQQPNRSQILHMLAPGVTFSAGSATIPSDAVVPYNRPRPPPVSDAHRYVELLYTQPENFSIPTAWSGYSSTNRTLFNIDRFAADAGLEAPIAVNYFLVNNKTVTNSTGPSGTGGGVGPSPTSSFVPISTGGAVRNAVGGGIALGGLVAAALFAL